MSAGEGLKNWSNTGEPGDWKSSWYFEWRRRELAAVIQWSESLIPTRVNTQLLGEPKAMGLLPGSVTEVLVFVSTTRSMSLRFLCSAFISKHSNCMARENPLQMLTSVHKTPTFLLAPSKSYKFTWDVSFRQDCDQQRKFCLNLWTTISATLLVQNVLAIKCPHPTKKTKPKMYHYFCALQISMPTNPCGLGNQVDFFLDRLLGLQFGHSPICTCNVNCFSGFLFVIRCGRFLEGW